MIAEWYFYNSVKSDIRQIRIDWFRRVHHLAINSPLPAKDVCLNSVRTKVRLIEVIALYLSPRKH